MQSNPITYPSIPEIEDSTLKTEIQDHLDDLTKPKGSLGRLEEYAARYLQCRGSAGAKLDRLLLMTFAGDHGSALQGITPFPQEVTAQMVLNMTSGGAAVSVFCRNAGIEHRVVDVGVAADLPNHPVLLNRKVASGSADFSKGYAMTPEQCAEAFSVGMECSASSGAELLGTGEIGIANTASASALYALLLGLDGALTTGPGTGAQGALLEKKKEFVHRSVALHRAQWDGTVFDALCRLGGLELAALTGYIVGAAANRIPVVIDGFICGAAALAALFIDRKIESYLFFSHVSAEQFHRNFLKQEKITPLLDLGMCLGEGTGAVLAMQLIHQAVRCYHEMATFSSASVSRESTVDV